MHTYCQRRWPRAWFTLFTPSSSPGSSSLYSLAPFWKSSRGRTWERACCSRQYEAPFFMSLRSLNMRTAFTMKTKNGVHGRRKRIEKYALSNENLLAWTAERHLSSFVRPCSTQQKTLNLSTSDNNHFAITTLFPTTLNNKFTNKKCFLKKSKRKSEF